MARPKRTAISVAEKAESGVLRDAKTGRLKKGVHLSPATQFQPKVSGNALGLSHKVRCAKLIEQQKCDENMARIAGGHVEAPHQTQVNAYEKLCDQAYGKAPVINVSASTSESVTFVKRIVGISDKDL